MDFVITVDYSKCMGCRSCELVCSARNAGAIDPVQARIRPVKIHEEATYVSIPVVCMKCINPPCKAVCPMKAISLDSKTGARVVDSKKCIGCSSCVYACPFGAIVVARDLGHSYVCSQCDGDPACVKFCPGEAIRYIDGSEVSLKLRRTHLNNFIAFGSEEVE